MLLVSKFLPARDAPRSDISRLPHNSSTDAVPSLPEFATTAEKTDFLQRITDRIRAVNHEAVQGPVHDPVKTPLLRAELKRRFMRGHCRGRLRAVFEGRRVSSARVVDRGDDFHALPALRPLSVAKLPSASSLLSKVKRRQDEDGEATGTAMGTVAPSSPLASDPVYHALTRQSMLEVERMKELDEEQQMRIIDGVLKRVCAVYLRGISDGESGDEKSCASSEEIGDERARDRAQDIGGKPTLIVARLRRTLHWLMETCFAVQRVDLARMAVSAYDEVAREIAYKENANDGSIKLTRSLRANKRQLVEALVKMQVEQGALKGAIGGMLL